MLRHFFGAAILVVMVMPVFGAPPAFETSPVNATTGKIGYLQPKTDAASVVYIPLPSFDFLDRNFVANKTSTAFVAKRAGKYTLYAVAASKDGEQSVHTIVVTVTDESNPDETPQDIPPVKPQPAGASQLFVYFIEATPAASTIRAKLFDQGQPLRKWQDAGSHFAGSAPINSTDPAYARYVSAAKEWVQQGNALPFMLVIRKNGESVEVVWKGKTPDAPGQILEILQRYTK